MPTLVCIVPSLGGGGAELHMLRVINELQERHFYKVYVLVLKRGGQYEQRCHPDIEILAARSPLQFSDTARSLCGFYSIRRILRDIDPDIVWSILPHTNISAVMAINKHLQRRVKLVLSEQTPPLARRGNSNKFIDRFTLALMQKMYPKADMVIALSSGVENELRQFIPLSSQQLTVIPNAGVEKSTASQSETKVPTHRYGDDDKCVHVISVGRLQPVKGFDILIEAISLASKTVPVKLWIIGDGPERCALQRLITDLGISDVVTLTGFIDAPEEILKKCDMFVLSSRAEGFGNVIVEAMAAGLPVIATDCPYGPREILDSGRYGVLVPPEQPGALASAIIDLAQDRVKRQQMVQGSTRRWQKYTAENIAQKHHELFQKILPKKEVA